MPQVLLDIVQTTWSEAISQPLVFLLILALGVWLLFQKTYVTILILCVLFMFYVMGDHYGFTS